MKIHAPNQPLTEAELDRLQQFLRNCSRGKAMNVEELDGFFTSLIAGPEIVMPSEYFPEVFGCKTGETQQFRNLEEANEILALMMRHWNDIAGRLSKGETCLPLLLADEKGLEHGNDWARGFIRGTSLRHNGWAKLLADDDHGGCMIPMLMLYHEHDKDPAMRPKPIGPEQRKKVIESMAAGVLGAYRYFRQRGRLDADSPGPGAPHSGSKVGRNDPCPCGSGQKYKRCCGGATVQ